MKALRSLLDNSNSVIEFMLLLIFSLFLYIFMLVFLLAYKIIMLVIDEDKVVKLSGFKYSRFIEILLSKQRVLKRLCAFIDSLTK